MDRGAPAPRVRLLRRSPQSSTDHATQPGCATAQAKSGSPALLCRRNASRCASAWLALARRSSSSSAQFLMFRSTRNGQRSSPTSRSINPFATFRSRDRSVAGRTRTPSKQGCGGREGTLIRDVVEYEVGFGVIGVFLEKVMFQRMMRSTFEYRKRALEKIFQTE